MSVQNVLIAIPLLAAAINAGIGVYALQFRALPAARSFAFTLFLVAQWGVAYSLELASPDLAGKVLWLKVRWPLFYCAVVWFIMALQLTGRDRRLRPWHVAVMCLAPTVTGLLQLTSGYTGLVRRDFHIVTDGPIPVLGWTADWIYGLHLIFTYGFLLATLSVLLWSLRRASYVLRRQILLVAGGTLVVLLVDATVALGHSPIPGYNVTWGAFCVSGILVGLALFRHGMFGVVPIATRLIVDTMPAPVLVLDIEHRIYFANQAALAIIGSPLRALLGQPTTLALARWSGLVAQYYDVETGEGEVTLQVGGEDRHFSLTLTPLLDRHGHRLARLMVMHDVTELRRAKDAAERALASVRVLSGLLPICASCKSIRDDEGYWQAVEKYVGEHADVEFTHGLCPDCAARIYAESQEQLRAARRTTS